MTHLTPSLAQAIFLYMWLCGQQFTETVLKEIQLFIESSPGISRRKLSRKVCEILDWRSSNGDFQLGGCRKALAQLNRQGLLVLPQLEHSYSFSNKTLPDIAVEIPEVTCSLADMGEIEIIRVLSYKSHEGRVWKSLLNRFHYLGSGKACGAQIRYLVRSVKYGYIGALSFSSGLFALCKRDEYIGWSESARRAHLGHVVLNNRFVILPSVHVHNLASTVLALALQRIVPDWESRYQIRPLLVETFVDPLHFTGTCYKASNWIYAGKSAGRRDGKKKDIYLYPLERKWRETLCTEPSVRLGQVCRPTNPGDWTEEEFGTCRLHDRRLKARLCSIAHSFFNRPLANIPEASGSYSSCKGSYRFFKNKKVTMDVILTPHVESTIERMKKHAVVLAPQDTTILNYSYSDVTGLGPIGNKGDDAIGMLLHDTVAFSPDGTPLGVIDAQCWVRDPEDRGKRERRKKIPFEEKESFKWVRSFRKLGEINKLCPDTTIVSICDRESDIFDFLFEATQNTSGPRLLIRADHGRIRKVREAKSSQEDYEYLWSFMQQQQLAGTVKLHIPKRENNAARDTCVDVRFSEITVRPPTESDYPPIHLWAVNLCEAGNPDEKNRIDWMLLTTVEVTSFNEAVTISEWYSGRWGIEVYHRTLKSGCRILDRQLGSAHSLQACLGVDMVVAWRVYHLTMLGREVPDHPCTVFFEDVEWKALYCYAHKVQNPPEDPPTLKEAIMMVGKIGGHLGRKCDGMPGTECIWRGLQRLDTAVDMYVIFTGSNLPICRNSFPSAMNLQSGP